MSEFHCPECGAKGLLQLSHDDHFACLECLHIHAITPIGRAGSLLTDGEFWHWSGVDLDQLETMRDQLEDSDKGVTL